MSSSCPLSSTSVPCLSHTLLTSRYCGESLICAYCSRLDHGDSEVRLDLTWMLRTRLMAPADSGTSRHEFYETDESLTLSIFDKGADPEQVKVSFEPRKVRTPFIAFVLRGLTVACRNCGGTSSPTPTAINLWC